MSTLAQTEHPGAPAAGRNRDRTGARLIDLIWLTWRQHRSAIVASLALTALACVYMLYIAARITTINQACGNAQCPSGAPQAAALDGTFGLVSIWTYLTYGVTFLPLLIGVFLGTPLLAREHEQRTLLLAWSQDITPQRWLWTKLVLLGALTVAVGAGVSACADHLAGVATIATGGSLFFGIAFLVTGALPLVESVVWLAVGVALGAAYRRVLPAIFTALMGYIAIFLVTPAVYPTFTTPLTAMVPAGSPTSSDSPSLTARLGANILVTGQSAPSTYYDGSGHPVGHAAAQSLCPSGNGLSADVQCLAQHHFTTLVHYQPGSRIPEFHLILTSGYLGLGAIAVAVVWWLVRRTSLSVG